MPKTSSVKPKPATKKATFPKASPKVAKSAAAKTVAQTADKPAVQPVVKPTAKRKLPASPERARVAAKIAAELRATDLCLLDLRTVTENFDFFVIATGTSRRQLHAISEEIDRVFEKELGDRRLAIAGYDESRWIVLDYGDILVHLFDQETREFYALEELWGRGIRCPLNETPTA